jgi:hypothetical protein
MTKRSRDVDIMVTSYSAEDVGERSTAEGDELVGTRQRHREETAQAELGCAVKQLPARLLFRAAEVAAQLNPVNAPVMGPSTAVPEGVLPTPLAAAVVTAKYWGPTPRKLTVSFMDNPSAELRRRILQHLNAWTRTGCIEFVETRGVGQVRIARGPGGYWSYLGTDILLIPKNRPTMNLQGFTTNTPEREWRRVVCHEAGHTLGMPHEHMRRELVARIDPEKAYEYFARTQGWDRRTVDQQVLTSLDDATLMFTPPDQDSIMCYQLPASITRDGQPIRGGTEIMETDYEFVGRIYPRPRTVREEPAPKRAAATDEWPEDEDVREVAV